LCSPLRAVRLRETLGMAAGLLAELRFFAIVRTHLLRALAVNVPLQARSPIQRSQKLLNFRATIKPSLAPKPQAAEVVDCAMMLTSLIRNFSIIAHIDHGKSTLADQFLLKTGAITPREFRAQVLDDMDLERERGITIQMHPVTIYYEQGGDRYELNLIDTPGHVDFNYEVSRSLAACEGAILLVDATQGVQAQTVANAFLAMEHELTIVPVLNKIDLPIARPDEVIAEMEQALGINPRDVLRVS